MKFYWRHSVVAAWLVTAQLAGAQSVPPPRPPAHSLLRQSCRSVPVASAEAPLQAPRQEDAAWSATLERVAQSVVAIKIDSTRAFDTDGILRRRPPAS